MTKIRGLTAFLMCLIAISQVLSPVLFIPGGQEYGLTVFRLIMLLCSVLILFRMGFDRYAPIYNKVLIYASLLSIWMVISLFWSFNVLTGVKHVSYVLSIMLILFTVSRIVTKQSEFDYLLKIVSVLGLLIIGVAFFEINTGFHFVRSSLQDESELDASLNYISENQAWFTFGNPNDLSVHLVLCNFCTMLGFRSKLYKIGYTVATLILFNILDARLSMVALVAFIFMLVFLAIIRNTKYVLSLPVLAFGLVVFIFSLGVLLVDQVEFFDLSTFVRLQLVASAIDMVQQSTFIGIGTGGFESEIWQAGYSYKTYGITNPHNMMARILAENGAIGFLLLGYVVFGSIFVIRGSRKSTGHATAIASFVVVLPLLVSIGSDPLASSSLQLLFAIIWVGTKLVMDQNSPAGNSHPVRAKES